jgi:hypothetical protein
LSSPSNSSLDFFLSSAALIPFIISK